MKLNFSPCQPGWKTAALQRSLGLCLLGLLLVGCPAQNQKTESSPTAGKKLVVRGSNTIGEELAPRLIAAYRQNHSEVAFDIEYKGTGYGLGALSSDTCDIAAASRIVSSNELDVLNTQSVELNEYIIGNYAVTVVVNASNAISGLSTEQVTGIFTGAIQNWKDVGGPDAPIHLYIRNPVSGTYLGFKELAMSNNPYAHAEKILTSYTEIVQDVAQDPAGVGYASLPMANIAGAKAVPIDGIEPTAANVKKGQYPYARILRFYTNKAKESSEAKNFIEFTLSGKGQQILSEAGFVPQQ